MRILHVVPTYLPAVRYGGPIWSVHGLCKALAALGAEVHVFTTNVDGPGNTDVPLDKPVDMDGVQVWYFPVPVLRRLYWSPPMLRALRARVRRFDLLHLHSVFLWPTWAAAREARRQGVPYMLSPRGMLVRELIERKSTLIKKAWIALIERANIEGAAGIHATSLMETEELMRFGFSLPGIHEVPNGVNAHEGTMPAERRPQGLEMAVRSGRPVLLCLGRINWKKGLDRLILALAQVPDAILLVVGNDEENYTPTLDALARSSGVRERVLFSGPVFGAEKLAVLRAATVFVLPSYSENFGNVVLEAMAEGCPVVVTPEVGASKIVEESGGGLVVRGEPEWLAPQLKRLLSNAELRAQMGLRGREWVRARHSWNAVATKMLAAYLQAMREFKTRAV